MSAHSENAYPLLLLSDTNENYNTISELSLTLQSAVSVLAVRGRMRPLMLPLLSIPSW